ncbi:hypothetical protein SELMODRAFT_419106 [Selaginella moellendorffii]|uniref:Uncharacterized protein n=1 Tax=Selaginella moellendorffii TaxID=88036 RepID=D8S7V3_SELML|nr:hypothetical protein SELMODRAFT_419106 [Selaginella moellendorffii]
MDFRGRAESCHLWMFGWLESLGALHPVAPRRRQRFPSPLSQLLVQELSCIYSDAISSLPDASLPDAKTWQNAAIIQGIQPPKDEREPAWMSELSEICRVVPEVFRVINWDVEVRSKSSAVLAHGSDAVLGIEEISGLSRQGLNRCEMEFYLWASSSKLPFLQLVTDFKSAAVFYYRFPRTGSIATLRKLVKLIASRLPPDCNCPESEMAWSILGWKRFGSDHVGEVSIRPVAALQDPRVDPPNLWPHSSTWTVRWIPNLLLHSKSNKRC